MNRTADPADAGQLYRLLYSSECAMGGPDGERRARVADLAQAASRSNRQRGITGSLLFVENCFVQVLEGAADRLETVFELICCDFRHRAVQLVEFNPVAGRLFDGWHMALLDEAAAGAPGDALRDTRVVAGMNAREAIRRMRALLAPDRVSAAG